MTSTRFQIASVSKQFAAVAVMLLVESGAVSVSDPVERWLPGVPKQWRPITLHQLLCHTAGIPHWNDAPGFDPTQKIDSHRRITLFQQATLLSEPGTQWHYSSPGYLVIAEILEKVCRQPYGEFVRDRIIGPLGLASTTVGDARSDEQVARGYRAGQPVSPWDTSAMPGTGDIYSTVEDLARFDTAVHSGALISLPSIRSICTTHGRVNQTAHSDDGSVLQGGYGYGTFIGSFQGIEAYFHPGDNPGYQALNAWLPGQAASIVILSNDEADDLEHLLEQVLSAALTE